MPLLPQTTQHRIADVAAVSIYRGNGHETAKLAANYATGGLLAVIYNKPPNALRATSGTPRQKEVTDAPSARTLARRLSRFESAHPDVGDFLISRCWLELRQTMKRYWRMSHDPVNNPDGMRSLEDTYSGGAMIREGRSEGHSAGVLTARLLALVV